MRNVKNCFPFIQYLTQDLYIEIIFQAKAHIHIVGGEKRAPKQSWLAEKASTKSLYWNYGMQAGRDASVEVAKVVVVSLAGELFVICIKWLLGHECCGHFDLFSPVVSIRIVCISIVWIMMICPIE